MAKLEIKFEASDPHAKPDLSVITSPNKAPWSNLADLCYDNMPTPGFFATLETNYTVLDGNADEFPDTYGSLTWGYFSDSVSDANGDFDAPPVLALTFNDPHKSPGLTLHFYPHTKDYAALVNVSWYSDSAGTVLLHFGQYGLNGVEAPIAQAVDGYRHIKIEFLKTNTPYRYVKLWAVEFGVTRIFTDDEIDACNVLEEIDPTSGSISINTLNARIRTRSSIFSPVTSPSFDDMMMERQKLELYRNGSLFGVFFLAPQGWEDVTQDGIVFDITAEDAMSVLDSYEFLGGLYNNKPAAELLDEIFLICFPTGIITYLLDVELQSATVTGYIHIGTCGEAFQHICFALNATADTARTDHIWIYGREVDVKSDGLPSSTDFQPFAPAENLRSHQEPTFFSSQEPNYTLLSGMLPEFPDYSLDRLNFGWISESMSDINGSFTEPPKVIIQFETTHNFTGLELNFGPYENEYMLDIRGAFYDEHGALIKQAIYTFATNPAEWVDYVAGYRRIEIEVLRTSAPERFARIAFIDYGKSFFVPLTKQYRKGRDAPTEFVSGVEVVSHRFSPIAEEITVYDGLLGLGQSLLRFDEPLHSLEISGGDIIDSADNWAIVNVAPVSLLSNLIQNPMFSRDELWGTTMGNAPTFIPGNPPTYSEDALFGERSIVFNVGVAPGGEENRLVAYLPEAITGHKYYGRIYVKTQGDNQPSSNAQFQWYNVTPNLVFAEVKGNYPGWTALSSIVQHGGATGGDRLRIMQSPTTTAKTWIGGVMIVDITQAFGAGNEPDQDWFDNNLPMFEGELDAYPITLTGKRYIDNTLTHFAGKSLPAGKIANVKQYENYSLVSPDTGGWLAQRIYDYYQDRIHTEITCVLNDLEVGYIAEVETRRRNVVGVIVRADSDLRANKADLDIIGNAINLGMIICSG